MTDREMDPILVFDDDENVRNLIAEVLTERGIPHVLVRDCRRALEEGFSGKACSAVITDLMMADIDGLDVVRSLAEDRPEVPVIVMSALLDEEAVISEVEGEPNVLGWLTKPLDLKRLAGLVGQALAVRRGGSLPPTG